MDAGADGIEQRPAFESGRRLRHDGVGEARRTARQAWRTSGLTATRPERTLLYNHDKSGNQQGP